MERLPPVCRIIADTFEQRSRVPDLLRDAGMEVLIARIPVGDYDLGRGVLVERKTVVDLHLTLERGRFWSQIGKLRDAARRPYLLVEGPDLDTGSVRPIALRGACLAVIGMGVALLRSMDRADSATWIRLLGQRVTGERLGRDRPVYAQRLKPPVELVPEAMLAAVPGISAVTARSLLDRFGSVSAVIAANEDEWARVPGIGQVRAAALRSAIS